MHGWLAGVLTYPQTLFSEVCSLFYGETKVMKKPGRSCGGIRCSFMTCMVVFFSVLLLRRQEKKPERTNLSVPHRCVSLPAISWFLLMPELLLPDFFISHIFAFLCPYQRRQLLATCSSEFGCVFILMFKNMGCWKSDWGKESSKSRQRGIESGDQFCNVLMR